MDRRQNVFLSLFFVSGACGLIYEVVWNRLLVQVFGGTTFATTTVLACFMGGLALGAHLGGRAAPRLRSPARAYGLVEIAVGLTCLLVPTLLELLGPAYIHVARITDHAFGWVTVARVLVCVPVLLIPTIGLGATLPLLSEAFAHRSPTPDKTVARFYGVNTLGACVGCGLAGFALLPWLGLSASTLFAALLNIGAGLAAVALGSGEQRPEQPTEEEASVAGNVPTDLPFLGGRGALLILYAVVGFSSMTYPVAWTRALLLSVGSSTYIFTSVVLCFVGGIGLGSLLIIPLLSSPRHTGTLAAALTGLIALSALVTVPLYAELPPLVARWIGAEGASFTSVLGLELATIFGLVAVPTLGMGALFPVINALYQRGAPRSTGRGVGRVYAANTIGTIIGAGVAGFILIPAPALGIQRTIAVASAAMGVVAAVFLLGAWRAQPLRTAIAVVALWALGAGLVIVASPWSRARMVSAPFLGRGGTSAGRVLFYREGVDSTVAVTESPDGLFKILRVNGKPDASNILYDMSTQLLAGHLPLLLHPDAREVCVIGLGSGVTAGAVLTHAVRSVEVVEI